MRYFLMRNNGPQKPKRRFAKSSATIRTTRMHSDICRAPAWLMQKHAEGYELDLKLWAGLWMIEHNPDGSRADDP